jgi:glycosyltransferase involved in cell wall biosynthesis
LIESARVFVIIPAYREAHRIARVLETMPSEVDAIIVVDDASDDGTDEVVLGSRDSRISLIRHARNRGVGAAIVTGYRRALSTSGGAHDAFVVMAGDGQMDPRDLPALVAPVVHGECAYVKGDRFGDAAAIPRSRFYGGRVMTLLTRLALGVDIHDSQCGYTAISRTACAALDLDALWPRFGYPNDLLAMLVAARLRISEVPVRAVYLAGGNKLGVRHVPVIAGVIGRAWIRRLVSRTQARGGARPVGVLRWRFLKSRRRR